MSFVVFLLIACPSIVFILLFRKTPDPDTQTGFPENYIHKPFDEREVMFSRAALKPGSERFDEYYASHPEHREIDDSWRRLPGLMSEDSLFADREYFASAEASFRAVFQFHHLVEGTPAPQKVIKDSVYWSGDIKSRARKLGAVDVGIARLKDYHLYSHIGRGKDYGQQVELDHPYAVAMTVEMDHRTMQTAPHAPVVAESARRYFDCGAIAVQLAMFIRSMGYQARAHIDGNYRVICPLVARDAGLGEIGRMGLLMTPKQGPRVRLAVVSTDMPLDPVLSEKIGDPTMIEFCMMCKKCAFTCPGQAISQRDRLLVDGVLRWRINMESCFSYWCRVGTDCGRCMSVCPYSHPDNPLHNFVRWGIKRNRLFRRIAVRMDDYIYGRNPEIRSD